jgi:fructokinase
MAYHPVVCFGEVLWDILPSGSVPGGAPINVAYHLHKLGKDPALITRVGYDKEGMDLVKVFSSYNVCTDFFQVDYEYETGKVFGKPNEFNEMTYDIVAPSAWDHIHWDEGFEELVSNCKYFVFGSLAARHKVSRDTLFRLLSIARCKVLDINLRAPFYNKGLIEELMRNCDVLKLNLDELELITGWVSAYASVKDRIKSVSERFGIDTVVVTMGADGAMLYAGGIFYQHKGYAIRVADTVGAGDAFLAGFLKSLLDGASGDRALEFAGLMGAFVASHTGACPVYDEEEVFNIQS